MSDFVMTFDRNVCAATMKENSRCALAGPLLMNGTQAGYGVSTDGRMLLIVRPTDRSGDVGWTIAPTEVVGRTLAEKRVSVSGSANGSANGSIRSVDLNRKGEEKSAARIGAPIEGTFPPSLVDVIPEVSHETHVFICVNPEFLRRLEQIEGDEAHRGVTLAIPMKDAKPMVAVGDRGLAVIMPINDKKPAETFASVRKSIVTVWNESGASGRRTV